MSEPRLVYFADPMCSWCYGFGPELDHLLRGRGDLRVDVVMGGLRPYDTERSTPGFRAQLAEHWAHVARESGLPFDDGTLAREDFVYDTEPACRAVVAVRSVDAGLALPFLKRVQRAFYAEGRDVTQSEVLADLAAEEGLDRGAFLASHASLQARDAVRQDFAATQQTGVTGFPTLAAVYAGGRHYLVTAGFARAADIADRLERIHAIAILE
jgi:putative protein-disulfide isomerase